MNKNSEKQSHRIIRNKVVAIIQQHDFGMMELYYHKILGKF
jgi:hypothetical protein